MLLVYHEALTNGDARKGRSGKTE